MTHVLNGTLDCARDWRWHLYCWHCRRCIGHGALHFLTGARLKTIETPPEPRACACGQWVEVLDTEARRTVNET